MTNVTQARELLRARVARVVDGDDSAAGRAFDLAVKLLVLGSVLSFSLETVQDLQPEVYVWLARVEIVTVAFFTAEYLLRLWVAERRWRFAISFYGLVDLLSVLPYYLALGVDLRSIRVVRFLRLLRLFKLARYSAAAQRYVRAIRIVREELVLFGAVAGILLYFSAVGVYYFERDAQPELYGSVFHSMWWAIVTLTTVGYGDIYPVTLGGRIFTCLVLNLGLGVVAEPTGQLASALSQARAEEQEEQAQG